MEKFIHVDRCDSTQDLLKEQLNQFPTDDLTVSCEHQILGRGRGSNSWKDSEGTICFSMTVTPHVKPSFTALELSTLVADFFSSKGIEIDLKWPNDLITRNEKKCGGILIQSFGSRYIAGIGVNLFQTNTIFGGVYETSFLMEKKSWANEMSAYIRNHRYLSTEALIKSWEKRCYHLNRKVCISENGEEANGIFKGLGSFGEAIIQNKKGVHHLYNGSLRLV